MVKKNNMKSAKSLIKAFKNRVNALINSGKISAAVGNQLYNFADQILVQ